MTKANTFVLYCKTYRGDLESFHRLVESFHNHNKDKLTLYVSVPQEDIDKFQSVASEDIILISDESYAAQYLVQEGYWGLSAGYVNQEICKLAFWETGHVDNYLCVDSDAYFIRDFYRSDFMANETTPYSVLVMDKDLNSQNFYFEFGKWRREHIKNIFCYVDFDDKLYRTCHGMTILNSVVLKDLKNSFMKKKKLEYHDLIKIAPYEYSWYNAWLQKCNKIDVIAVEPFFKTFHLRKEYLISRISMVTERNLAEYYVGIIMNSNWKPVPPPERYRDPGRVCELAYNILDRLK